MTSSQKSLTVPIADDLAVYARVLSDFYSRRSQKNYALVVLAQRVVLERSRVSKKKAARLETLQAIERINSDPEYRAALVLSHDASNRLAGVYPHYVQAGLIQNSGGVK